ncbi:MAG: helix-turn-helix transcriptional regulator [Liquorilactobacillus nagelii]|uniref:helix-turn-helix transcriptional regulator n=1 Tax=Oenococcus sicerae TaxID=2203724 RepID=UPI0039EC68A7
MNKPNWNLKNLRDEHKLTQYDVGKAVGVSDVTISKIELGKIKPRVELAFKLAKYFDVSVAVILGEKQLEEMK